MSEQERGPLEKEIHELIRSKGLAMPEILESSVAGTDPDLIGRINIAWQMNMILVEAILRLAREVDDLRSGH